MTIKDVIIKAELRALKERVEKLQELEAPDVMITSTEQEIDRLESGNLKIGGNVKLLEVEFVSSENKVGRGGKGYVQFNGSINYFPNAKYGRYIAKGETI